MDIIEVMLCENNRHGNKTGQVGAIEFYFEDESFLSLETNDLAPQPCITNDRIIEMYGVRVKFSHFAEMVGNILWNQYTVPVNYALGFINMLAISGYWNVSEGYTDVYDKFRKKELITGGDINESLVDNEPVAINTDNQLELPFFDYAKVIKHISVAPGAGPEVFDAVDDLVLTAYNILKNPNNDDR